MREVCIELREFANSFRGDSRDLLKVIAAIYAMDTYYVEDLDAELEDVEGYVSDSSDDFLINIQNTLANVDRDLDEPYYHEDEENICEDDEDYYEDEDEDCYCDEEECGCGNCPECTQRLIEANRKKSEQVLGL